MARVNTTSDIRLTVQIAEELRAFAERQEQTKMAEMTVECIESDGGFGWWTPGWVDMAEFTSAYRKDAKRQMGIGDDELLYPEPSVHGYARESFPIGYEYWVTFSEKPNGGKRATYVWFPI